MIDIVNDKRTELFKVYNLTAKYLYLGLEDREALFCSESFRAHGKMTVESDFFAGLEVIPVNKKNHFNVSA